MRTTAHDLTQQINASQKAAEDHIEILEKKKKLLDQLDVLKHDTQARFDHHLDELKPRLDKLAAAVGLAPPGALDQFEGL